ncbi:MAG: serine/threonine-protein phosphatase [Negativicutes bacterium]|nr:serine/threonine-protein phosphatase [Negativicutes bacterium]
MSSGTIAFGLRENKMKILLGGTQDIGRRENQQDAFYISTPAFGHTAQADRNLLVVCDGIGGASFGKEAAQIACEALKGFLITEDEIYDVPEALLQAARYANNEVVGFMISRGVRTVGGTTLIAALIKNDMLYWISVGDSHIYLFSDAGLEQINEDHLYGNVLDAAVAEGKIDKAFADKHPRRDSISSFIGIWELKEISSGKTRLSPGTSVLLCTDGLYKTLNEDEIIDAYDPDPQKWANVLIKATLEKDVAYQDNVTIAIATAKE